MTPTEAWWGGVLVLGAVGQPQKGQGLGCELANPVTPCLCTLLADWLSWQPWAFSHHMGSRHVAISGLSLHEQGIWSSGLVPAFCKYQLASIGHVSMLQSIMGKET